MPGDQRILTEPWKKHSNSQTNSDPNARQATEPSTCPVCSAEPCTCVWECKSISMTAPLLVHPCPWIPLYGGNQDLVFGWWAKQISWCMGTAWVGGKDNLAGANSKGRWEQQIGRWEWAGGSNKLAGANSKWTGGRSNTMWPL